MACQSLRRTISNVRRCSVTQEGHVRVSGDSPFLGQAAWQRGSALEDLGTGRPTWPKGGSAQSLGGIHKPQGPADDAGIRQVPQVVTHGPPLASVEDLHATLVGGVPIGQPHVPIFLAYRAPEGTKRSAGMKAGQLGLHPSGEAPARPSLLPTGKVPCQVPPKRVPTAPLALKAHPSLRAHPPGRSGRCAPPHPHRE